MPERLEQAAFLEQVAQTYRGDSSQDTEMRRRLFDIVGDWMRPGGAALEVGCSDGFMSELISRRVEMLDIVEATRHFQDVVTSRSLPNARIHGILVEDFCPERSYDYIFCTWVLTHVPDAQQLLQRLRAMLAPQGLLFVAVPNARVLSRQLALAMGLLDDLYGLTDNDRKHGHCRAYDRSLLNRELVLAGYDTLAQGAILLKPLADFQMDALIDSGVFQRQHLDGLMSLGHEYPDLCSAIYSVCRAQS
jgi:protein-L-isoaspartate O-methyltransferase